MSEAVQGLIIAHASLAEGFAAAVERITGAGPDVLRPLSNEGRGPDALAEAIAEVAGDAPVVLFADLGGGSCAFAARKMALQRPGTAVICGVNLPVLVEFVFRRELPLPTLVERLLEAGRGSISGAWIEETAHADRVVSR
jgi:mannose/fructose-specific phosphotransferase system component IIA